MSPWEVIGWAIAIPMVFITVVFVIALIVATFRAATKKATSDTDRRPRRHLRIVEDE